ncbi:MAG: aminoglycoside phosphotransferase family protein [Planctomycetota bacterium]|nr:aminoglycoside phosphotransferase family protein [Planctomycetota bacterium]MDA1211236.1 aminoglycoside phosphotransferase family protein [Planctomycetota bacterium]
MHNPYSEFDETNIRDYLVSRGILADATRATATALAWGVSNVVIRIDSLDRPDFVVKQSRPQLRTKADWFSRPDRIFREVDVMRALSSRLPPGTIPQIEFEDRSQYLFAMEAVPADHRVWKGELLAGTIDLSLAEHLGAILAEIHQSTAGCQNLREQLGNRAVFDELRLDPFYRYLQRMHPCLAPTLGELIDETLSKSLCVVHADFSPKNILLHDKGLTLVDFETGHFGDPAFDLGFFLSHLLLKGVGRPQWSREFVLLAKRFWDRYTQGRRFDDRVDETHDLSSDFTRRSLRHLSACLLARVDGKSPVDYLADGPQKEFIRRWSIDNLLSDARRANDECDFHRYVDEFSRRLATSGL